MRVLIIAGPHAGEVHKVPTCLNTLELINPGQMEPVRYTPSVVVSEPCYTTTTYRIRTAVMQSGSGDSMNYFVGIPRGVDTEPMMALLRYAVGRCYDNPTNP